LRPLSPFFNGERETSNIATSIPVSFVGSPHCRAGDAKGAYGDGVDGLLGMSFLSHFKLSMDTQTLRVSRR